MSTLFVMRAVLRWHLRKARRTFQLLGRRLAAPNWPDRPTGVRWG